MKISKIIVPSDVYLVEIVSDKYLNDENKYEDNHMVIFLDKDGAIVDYVHISGINVYELKELIPFMFVINFTPKEFWEMQCATMFNRIFEPDIRSIFDVVYWQMDDELVAIFREYGKMIHVANYMWSDECREEAHIIDDFIYSRPSPIERKSEDVHERGIASRTKMLKIIKNWVL